MVGACGGVELILVGWVERSETHRVGATSLMGIASLNPSYAASCFALYENTADAKRAADKILREHPEWRVHAGVLS
jgi:hypothetical protein